jgi:hypothetical protein
MKTLLNGVCTHLLRMVRRSVKTPRGGSSLTAASGVSVVGSDAPLVSGASSVLARLRFAGPAEDEDEESTGDSGVAVVSGAAAAIPFAFTAIAGIVVAKAVERPMSASSWALCWKAGKRDGVKFGGPAVKGDSRYLSCWRYPGAVMARLGRVTSLAKGVGGVRVWYAVPDDIVFVDGLVFGGRNVNQGLEFAASWPPSKFHSATPGVFGPKSQWITRDFDGNCLFHYFCARFLPRTTKLALHFFKLCTWSHRARPTGLCA